MNKLTTQNWVGIGLMAVTTLACIAWLSVDPTRAQAWALLGTLAAAAIHLAGAI